VVWNGLYEAIAGTAVSQTPDKGLKPMPSMRIMLLALLTLSLALSATAQTIHTYPATTGPDRNPHKGWSSGWSEAQPDSTVGFQYLPWKDFEPTNGSFDFAKVEEILARPGTKGQHFVLRLYCEWHHSKAESDCPAWLYTQVGVRRLRGDNGAALTDFNDAKYLNEAVQAIQALAQRYDRDPRVHAFQLGVLGCWGEWHGCGFKQNGVEYKISDASRNQILQAYQTYFKKSPLQGRYPWDEPLKSDGFLGFHNDFFIPGDSQSDRFDGNVDSLKLWQGGPIGGEAPPRESAEAINEKRALFETDTGRRMIETGHYSTMKPGAYRIAAGDRHYAQYMNLHRLMGYNFRIDRAVFVDALSAGQTTMTVRLDARNVGVAPLHRPWTAEFALLDAQDRAVSQTAVAASVPFYKVAAGGAFSMTASLRRSELPTGSYRVAVRLIQPGAGTGKAKAWGLDARRAYILFANSLPIITGQWSTNHALVGGWSVLGSVQLR
jgi:hypothetical protein